MVSITYSSKMYTTCSTLLDVRLRCERHLSMTGRRPVGLMTLHPKLMLFLNTWLFTVSRRGAVSISAGKTTVPWLPRMAFCSGIQTQVPLLILISSARPDSDDHDQSLFGLSARRGYSDFR